MTRTSVPRECFAAFVRASAIAKYAAASVSRLQRPSRRTSSETGTTERAASAESAATGIALAPHTDAIVLGGWTHNYAVPGSYYYGAAQLTDDTIFYDDFE